MRPCTLVFACCLLVLLQCSAGCSSDCPAGFERCGETCANLQADRSHCGGCTKACASGQICTDGACVLSCQEGLSECKGTCVDTQSDRRHCGGCGKACLSGQLCDEGSCGLLCAKGQVDCSGLCVDTQHHRGHCGTCGKACKDGQSCISGQCSAACPSGFRDCKGRCTDLKIDRTNCGICGNSCPQGQVCDAGKCAASCQKDRTDCKGSCVDTQRHSEHCGGCDKPCKGGEICKAGACDLLCSNGTRRCKDACIDLQHSRDHCGQCDNACAAGEICQAGACTLLCPKDFIKCDGACVRTDNDPKHCGGCNKACQSGEVCQAGACTHSCQRGTTDCKGSCVNTAVDPKHCGGCDKACSAGATCASGQCASSCPRGLRACSGACVDSSTNGLHCGACNSPCSGVQACIGGSCKACNDCPSMLRGATSFSTLHGLDVAVDSAGNGYITGHFRYVATFGSLQLKGKGSSSDLFVAKIDASGTWLWAASAGGSDDDQAHSVAVDAAGNVYVTGQFKQAASFGTLRLTGKGSGDAFVAKLDKDGKWLWAKQAGGTSLDASHGIAVDGQSDVYITGTYNSSATFGSTTLTSKGSYDVFVAKLDKDGKWLWAKSFGGSSEDAGHDIAVDSKSNIHITGRFYSTATFEGVSLSVVGSQDVFVAKLDKDGKVLWAKGAGGTSLERAHGIAVDSSGRVGVVGSFNSASLTASSLSLKNIGKRDVFVLLYDASGKALHAAAAGSDAKDDEGFAIGFDSSGQAAITGSFHGEAQFGAMLLRAQGDDSDIFIATLDKNGQWTGATQAGGSFADKGMGLAVGPKDGLHVTGYIAGIARFGQREQVAGGGEDLFFAQYSKRQLCPDIGHKICANTCRDVSKNNDHCGACGNKCPSGQFCISSTCSPCPDCPFVLNHSQSGVATEQANAVAVDSSGNIYVTGYFKQSASFGATKLSSQGSNDIFVAKADKAGKWLWAKSAGSSSADEGYGVAVDSSGNVYITGRFRNTVSFGATQLVSKGYDIFVAKLDAKGKWLWAQGAGGTSTDYGNGIAVDSGGNAYVTGYFRNAGSFGTTNLTSNGSYDAFVAKLDAQGKWLWVKNAGGTSGDYGYGVAVSATGDVYITGGFSQSNARFGTLTTSSQGGLDVYLAKLNNAGVFQWVRRAGASSNDYGFGVALDSSGNPHVAGTFYSTVTFAAKRVISKGNGDIFVAKYTGAGLVSWASSAGTPCQDQANAVAVDSSGNVYVTGYFSSCTNRPAQFGPVALNSKGDDDLFLARLDKSGQWFGAVQVGSSGEDVGFGVATLGSDAYVAGKISGIAQFGFLSLKSDGDASSFVAGYRAALCPASGYAVCQGACLDTNSNDAHCGSCANACASGKSCQNGFCQ